MSRTLGDDALSPSGLMSSARKHIRSQVKTFSSEELIRDLKAKKDAVEERSPVGKMVEEVSVARVDAEIRGGKKRNVDMVISDDELEIYDVDRFIAGHLSDTRKAMSLLAREGVIWKNKFEVMARKCKSLEIRSTSHDLQLKLRDSQIMALSREVDSAQTHIRDQIKQLVEQKRRLCEYYKSIATRTMLQTRVEMIGDFQLGLASKWNLEEDVELLRVAESQIHDLDDLFSSSVAEVGLSEPVATVPAKKTEESAKEDAINILDLDTELSV